MRTLLAAVTAASLLLPLLPATASASGLKDMQRHWARDAVEMAVKAGYVSGYPDGTFRPQNPVTRAEFMKMLGAGMRVEPGFTPTGFAEQAAGKHWAFVQGYIPAAVRSGLLVPGDYGARYEPDRPITRREILMATVRAMGLEAEAQKPQQLNVPDGAAYEPWLRNFAAIALRQGIMTGYEDGTLGLNQPATRAEALVMVQRVLTLITMGITPEQGPTRGLRHPGEGEPLWTWEQGRVTDGTHTYELGSPTSDLALLPAPGQTAWVRYRTEGGAVVARLHEGKLTEAARLASRLPVLLTVDDEARLWYTDGAGGLFVAGARGTPLAVSGVAQPVQHGAIDWEGRFWGLSKDQIYQIAPDGAIAMTAADLPADRAVKHFSLAEDGSAWVVVDTAPGGARAEALRLRDGRVIGRVALLGPTFGGVDATDVRMIPVGQAGPFLWMEARVGGKPEGLFRLNLQTGAYSRLVPPVDGLAPVAAPDGGVLMQDKAGKFWRLLPG